MFDVALMAQVLVWLVVLGIFLASRQASFFHPSLVYLAFHGIVFVVRPILVHYLDFNSIWHYVGYQPSDEVLIKTLAVTSVALVVFVGVNLWVGRARVEFPAEPAGTFSGLQKNSLIATIILLAPLIAWSIKVSTGGQVTGERTANGVFIMTNSTGYINDAQFMLAPLLCAWLLLKRFHWATALPAILYLAYRAWCGWSRFTLITFCLSLVMAYCWYHRKKWIPLAAIMLALPLLLLYNILGHNRDYLQTRLQGNATEVLDFNAGMSPFEKFRARTDTQDFANFDYLSFLVAFVPARTQTYSYGAQYLQLFTEPIPRILWKGKPTGAPIATFNISSYGNFTGLTFSLPGDGWSSGGWVGLVATMAAAGALLGWFHRWFWRNSSSPMVAVFYTTAAAMLMLWFRDGGISIAKFMLWSWLPLLIWLGLTWVLGGRLVPGFPISAAPGERLRFVRPQR